MFEQRKLQRDLLALLLLAAVIFLAAALVSYDPADPPGRLVWPQNETIHNVCGRSGAIVSQALFEALGLGAYYLVFSLAALDYVLMTRRAVTQPWLRLAGWIGSLLGLTALAAMACPWLSPGPVIGAGGHLGVAGRGLLEKQFAQVGGYIVASCFILGGWLLCTDYVVLRILAWVIGKPTRQLGRGVIQVGAAYAQRVQRKRTDLDGYQPAALHGRVAVKIRGRSSEAEPAAAAPAERKEPAEAAAAEIPVKAPAPPPPEAPPEERKRRKKTSPKEEVQAELASVRPPPDSDYELPSLELLLPGDAYSFDEQEQEVRERAKILEQTFHNFGLNVQVVEIQTGPVISQFEVELEAGLRLNKITALADDLAIALRVPSVRIVAPIPGKNTVGIEVPNTQRQLVRLREVMEESNGRAGKMRIPLFLGKDVAGNPLVIDLTTLPHLLIAGRTGTGKSVCLNSIIASMLMTRRPDEVRLLLVDPKLVELSPYKSLPHLMHPVVTDMRKAEAILGWAVEKMEERYHLLARAGVRHISVYNQLGEEELMERVQPENDEERSQIPLQMPYIVIVADEMADLMMTAAKEVEQHIIRLAQKSRAVGIHLVLATQKPTVDVITGLIKSNLPARIAFQVSSRTDSRVVLDEMGADRLLGNGDLLFLWPGTSTLIRGQGTFLSDDEITKLIAAVATDQPEYVKELVQLKPKPLDGEPKTLSSRDEMYEAAVDVVIREGRGSVSLLQRALGIGYGRAARLIDFMAEDGIVGPYNGSQAREVVISLEQWETLSGQKPAAAATEATVHPVPKPHRSNKILLGPHQSDPPFDADEDESWSPPQSNEEDSQGEEEDDDFDDDEEVWPDDDRDEFPSPGTVQRSGRGQDEGDEEKASDDNHPRPGRWKAESA
ncbi:MAG: DNA translocase FtsK [Pirellulales bacterium]|nr:DNA translocase FtsK [Pirellulales bacterium]